MSPTIEHPRCPFCHDGVRPAEGKTACLGCMSWHHLECWSEAGRCAACGRHARFGLQAGAPQEQAQGCPRCSTAALERGRYEDLELRFCGSCWGSWVPLASLGALLLGAAAGDWPPAAAPPGLAREAQVPCFECRGSMEKWTWRRLTLDCCPGHGLWLDSGELSELRARSESHPSGLYQLLTDLRAT